MGRSGVADANPCHWTTHRHCNSFDLSFISHYFYRGNLMLPIPILYSHPSTHPLSAHPPIYPSTHYPPIHQFTHSIHISPTGANENLDDWNEHFPVPGAAWNGYKQRQCFHPVAMTIHLITSIRP